jgi:hypothetical protein
VIDKGKLKDNISKEIRMAKKTGTEIRSYRFSWMIQIEEIPWDMGEYVLV